VIALKKWIYGLLIIGSVGNADIEVKMNTKALYKETFETLSTEQQDYILDNMDKIQNITEAEIKAQSKDLMREKFIDQKNVVEFTLTPDGKIEKLSFMARSDERRFDNHTKKAIESAATKYKSPKEPTPIRMIVSYQIGQKQGSAARAGGSNQKESSYNQAIPRGTTRFEHSISEQIREFETSKDGFVNINTSPGWCANLQLLKENNQRVMNGLFTHYPTINKEVTKGKYKLSVLTKETCNINIQYP
jgi:TonB family protein